MAHTAQPCLTCAYLTDRPFSHAMQCTLSSTRRQMAQCQPRYIPENDRNSKHETSERQKHQHNANRNHFSHIAVRDNNCHNANAAKYKMRPHSVQSTKHSRGHEMNKRDTGNKCTQNLKKRHLLGNLGSEGCIILTRILKKHHTTKHVYISEHSNKHSGSHMFGHP